MMAALSAMDDWAASQSLAKTTTATAQRSRRENSARHNYANLDSGKSAALPADAHLLDILNAAKQFVAEKKNEVKISHDQLAAFYRDHCTTYEDFKAHGLNVSAPIAAEYKRLFIEPTGDYFAVMKANMAARALNPLEAATMSDLELKESLSDLSAYGFDEFRPRAIQDIINEIPTYRALIASTPLSFWSEVDGAEKYDILLKKRAEGNPEKYGNHTWQGDRIEKSRRIWEWWRVKASKLHYFFTAARLVALVPLSSASVERAFSQVKLIIEAAGENVLEETLEIRVMERINDFNLLH